MSIYSLAASARGMFIAMLIIMIVVSLLFGFVVFVLFKTGKKGDAYDADNVKRLLAVRESKLVVEIMACKDNEEKKNELTMKLRRVRSAMTLIDELLKEEKAMSDAIEAEEKAKKKSYAEKGEKPAAYADVKQPERKPPVERPAANGGATPAHQPAPQFAHQPAEEKVKKPEKQQKEKKSLFKKKDDNLFKPSDD